MLPVIELYSLRKGLASHSDEAIHLAKVAALYYGPILDFASKVMPASELSFTSASSFNRVQLSYKIDQRNSGPTSWPKMNNHDNTNVKVS